MTKQLFITVPASALITTGVFAQAAGAIPADLDGRYQRVQELLSECYHQESGNIYTFPNHAHKNRTNEETD